MTLDAVAAAPDAILAMREDYRRAMGCQVVHDSWHARGFAQPYLLLADGEVAGYGAVGGAPREAKDTVKELYVLPARRAHATALFRRLVEACGARTIEAQTNDPFLAPVFDEFARDATVEKLLFAAAEPTALAVSGATFRALDDADRAVVFAHEREDVGDWGIEHGGRIVATGGLTFHYNPPWADVYMEVDAAHRRRGFGSLLVQELVRTCRESGRRAAARCDPDNVASRRTLLRAGMRECGRILRGTIEAAR